MKETIIIGGFGGQGVMLSGTLLCHAGMKEAKSVTFFPSYGAEMRGGTANCNVILSKENIGSPIVDKTETLMAFNMLAYQKFLSRVNPNGIVIVNDSLFTPELPTDTSIQLIRLPANALAEKVGASIVLNMIMLGALIATKPLVNLDTLISVIPEVLTERKKRFWDINTKAIHFGFDFVKNNA